MLTWYLARGAGLAAFVMLSIATGVGALGARRTGDPARRVLQQYAHRAAAATGLALILAHVVTLLADSYAHVGVRGLLPFGAGYRPLAVTMGVLATYLLIAVGLTGALRSRFTGSPRAVRLWRRVHLASYGAWALAAGHFLLAGTDSGTWWAWATLAGGVAIVAAGVGARLTDRHLITQRRVAPVPVRPIPVPSAETGRPLRRRSTPLTSTPLTSPPMTSPPMTSATMTAALEVRTATTARLPRAGSIGPARLLAGMHTGDLRDPAHHLAVHGPPPRLSRDALLALLDAVPVHGRGGAGFSLAAKLRSLRGGAVPIVVVNGAEGEPASAKDRLLLARFPHLVLDGAATVADAIGADRIVLAYTDRAIEVDLVAAVAHHRDRRHMTRHIRPRFIAGEARALIDALRGGPGLPPGRRVLPTERGLDGRPTLLSNVETFAQLAVLARLGPTAFATVGTPGEPGTTLLTVSGAVAEPGVLEVPLGCALETVADAVGAGPTQAVVVGGYHGGWLDRGRPTADPPLELSRAGLHRAGGTLGAGAVIFVGADTCGLGELSRAARWLADQSAKQCGPCAFGLPALVADIRALAAGRVDGSGPADAVPIDSVLRRHLTDVVGRGACAHPDGAVRFITSGLAALGDDLARHRVTGSCGRPVLGHLVLS